MSKLSGKVAVITGGSGVVGSGAIRAYLQQGAHVVAPTRNVDAVKKKIKEQVGEAGSVPPLRCINHNND